MKQRKRSLLSLLMAAAVLINLWIPAAAAEQNLSAVTADTAACLYKAVPTPQVASVGGEWTILGLARSGSSVPAEYYRTYKSNLEAALQAQKGVLHARKYTEYSRVILALSALGEDARHMAGYDLTLPLGDFEKTIWQGLNGPIWALIALDSRDYPMPQNLEAKTQATRQMYVDHILEAQLPEGGWCLSGTAPDPDLTGMALQALAKYRQQPAVENAVQKALRCMSGLQQSDGGYGDNAECCVQMLVALCELGLSPEDARFVKSGHSLLDALLSYYRPGVGFLHMTSGSGSNLMATEQALYALAAVQRARTGQSSLYRMADAKLIAEAGLPGRDPAVQSKAVILPGKTFTDLSDHPARTMVEDLASRGIINGTTETRFQPNDRMTRAAFAILVVRALGLTPEGKSTFSDVPDTLWYAPYIQTACRYGIVNGIGGGRYAPADPITRQQAAAMVARAAVLTGLDTNVTEEETQQILSGFADLPQTGAWARPSLAFCCREGILNAEENTIRGTEPIKRYEVAQMLWHLLDRAELL